MTEQKRDIAANAAAPVATLPESAPEGVATEPREKRTTAKAARRFGPIPVAVLCVLAVVLGALAGWQWWEQRQLDTLRDQAVETTRDYAQTVASFDYQNLDANRDKIAGMSTSEFTGQYNKMVDALRTLVTDGQGQATATVSNIGVESVDDSSAVVLAFVDQEAKNVVAPEGKSQKYRMVVTLERDGDRWIVDNVETK
ncbi:mce associated protein mas1a [Prescottella equi]|uniref:mce associated protein mas1a n=1 Tax=Rhodococcus hoagii TaxID=43767 RepID=UPI000A1040BB|nr:mce associated protein mas1a [Prescottella equi]NKR23827.1 mce associated protein mas1a [Prescottella equi]NKR58792.1 mce associated protein mas1a [Prescottella equi]NKR69462.1 mce associated protein mas1a [Prescottella equi]NKR93204.1 mce associated protein mas1a [Prescottella equi]NKT05957.1 mce associated protein mas1a [Prescottella equi]